MFPIPGLSGNSVSLEALSGFPFDSPAYDPLQSNGLRCKQLLDTLRLSNQSITSYFELLNGEGQALENLSRELVVPIRFFEVLANNNGCYHALTTFNEDRAEYFRELGLRFSGHLFCTVCQHPEIDLFVKLPSSFLNSAIYFRHDLLRETTVCLLFGNEIHRVESAVGQMFLPSRRSSTSPMQIVDTIVSEYVALMEPHRHSLDVSLRQLEAKTGMGAHEFHESQRVAATELNDLMRELHVCEGQLAFFERTVQFQAGWIEWLQAQHPVLNQLRFGTRELISLPPLHRPAEEGVASSLSLCASLSRESLEQARTLRNRVRIQLSVAANLISQNDSRTNIAIADASRRIAFETRRDSDAMKTIAALTMVFLPGTFVAVRTQLLSFSAKASDTRHV
ncbi:MAG: hypothetical protein LQ349_007785 [Xanthoria aureola]|nr:MAG: hypothetical protein LQ349_007785 [Xanthoria aureola]